jgi:predicted amidohydrolase YtcJ
LSRDDPEAVLRSPDGEAGRFYPGEETGRVYRGGRFRTMDPSCPECGVLGVWGGRIVYAGDDPAEAGRVVRASAGTLAGDGAGKAAVMTEDLRGRPAVPGLIDSHSHLITEGVRLSQLDVSGKSMEEAAAMAGARASELEPGAWLHGRGWDQNLWPSGAWPGRGVLDRACPRNPVVMDRVDKHSVWANTMALDMAGIRAGTEPPPGGEIVRDPDGTPAGVLVGRAMHMVYSRMPAWDGLDPMEAFLAAEREMLGCGLTAVVDCGTRKGDFLMLLDAYRNGVPKVRFKCFVQPEPWEEELLEGGPRRGMCAGRFSLDGVKLFSDGSLGSRSAWMLSDYADRPGHRGTHSYTDEALEAVMEKIRDRGLQAAVHVIGDAAAAQAVRAMGRVLGPASRARRWRLEHFQLFSDGLAREAAALGLIPSIQSVGLMTDLHMAPGRLGPERVRDAYGWRRLLELGSVLINGSDAPIESPDPFRGIYAACARRDLDWMPPGGFQTGDALTVGEALRSYTVWPAWASFCEGELGALSVGKRADFAVLDRDLFETPVRELHAARALMTVIGGSPAWVSPEF